MFALPFRVTDARCSGELFPEAQSAETKKQIRHNNKHQKVRPVFEKICTPQNDRAHKRNEIRRGKQRTQRVKNPRHGFTRENEPGKENARRSEEHTSELQSHSDLVCRLLLEK